MNRWCSLLIAVVLLIAVQAHAKLHEILCQPMLTDGAGIYTDCGLSAPPEHPATLGCIWNDADTNTGWGSDGRLVEVCPHTDTRNWFSKLLGRVPAMACAQEPRMPIFQFVDQNTGKGVRVPYWECRCDSWPMEEGKPCR